MTAAWAVVSTLGLLLLAATAAAMAARQHRETGRTYTPDDTAPPARPHRTRSR